MIKAPRYIVGGTLDADHAVYVVRSADAHLLDLCRTGAYAYVLSSRQMGKSSLTVRTARRLRDDGLDVAVVDLTLIGVSVSEEEWYAGFSLAVSESLGHATPLAEIWPEREGQSAPQRLVGFFERLLAGTKRRLTVFIDEIDTTLTLPFRDDFFAVLRYMYNARPINPDLERLSFVLIGVASPDDLIRDPHRTPFNVGTRVDLSDFSPAEAAPLAAGLGFPAEKADKALETILEWSGGHPYLTQRLCADFARTLTELPQPGEWTGALDPAPHWWERSIGRLLTALPVRFGFSLVCRAFTRQVVRRNLLWSYGGDDTNLRDVRDMLTRRAANPQEALRAYGRIRRPWSRIPDDERSEAISHLKLTGIVVARDGYLTVRNRIYASNFDIRWLYEHLPAEAQNRWKNRARIAAFAALAALLLVLAPAYWTSNRERNRLRSLQYASVSAAQRSADPELAAMIAVEAVRAYPTAQAVNALRSALGRVHDSTILVASDKLALPEDAEFAAPDRAVVRYDDGRSVEWDLAAHTRMSKPTPPVPRACDLDAEATVVSADGRTLATIGSSQMIRVWNRDPCLLRGAIAVDGAVQRVMFNPAGDRLALVGPDRSVRVYDTRTVRLTRYLGSAYGRLTAAEFDPKGKTIAAADSSGRVYFWGVESDLDLPSFSTHSNPVRTLAFAASDEVILRFEDGSMECWTSKGDQRWQTRADRCERCAEVSGDGRWLATVSGGRTVEVRATDSGELVGELRGHSAAINSLRFDAGSSRLISTSLDGTARVWSWHAAALTIPAHSAAVSRMAVLGNDRLVSAGDDNRVRLWDLHSGKLIREFEGLSAPVEDLAASQDRSLLAAASSDRNIVIWGVDSGKVVATGRTQSVPTSIAFSRNGKMLAAADYAGSAVVWAVADVGRSTMYEAQMGHPLLTVQFGPEDRSLAMSGEEGFAGLWSLASNRLIGRLQPLHGAIRTISYSPNGFWVGAGDASGTVRTWSARTGEAGVLAQKGDSPISQVAFSPDSMLAVSGDIGGRLRVYSMRDGRLLRERNAHRGGVARLRFSGDGKYLLSAGQDHVARIWQVDTAEPVAELRGHGVPLTDAAVSADGKLYVTAGEDGTIRVFPCAECVSPESLMDLAGRRLQRGLSAQERHDLLSY